MKIGVIGAGRIGSTVGSLLAQAGYPIRFASRHPEELDVLVTQLGPNASRGNVRDAAQFGDVVVVAVPTHALPEVGREIASHIVGKVILETSNPNPERDGTLADTLAASGQGSGPFAHDHFVGARVVRGFNSVWDRTLYEQAHRPDPKVAIPLASDHRSALLIAEVLVRAAGFEPVVVGGLNDARLFDVGSPLYDTSMTAAEVRAELELPRSDD